MMKNKSKFGYVAVAVFAMALAMGGVANAANLTFNADYAIDLTGTDLTITSGSLADSLVVRTTDIQVTVGDGESLTVTSATTGLSVGGLTSSRKNVSCSGGVGTAVITGGADGETITISTTGACDDDTGGGGGGGGAKKTTSTTDEGTTPSPAPSTGVPSAPVNIPSLPASPSIADISNVLQAASQQVAYILANRDAPGTQALIASLLNTLSQLSAAVAGALPDGAPPVQGALTSGLGTGTTGAEVSTLQTFLKSQGPSIYPEGIVSGLFGPLTEAAVERFQVREGIAAPGSPGYGFVGPATRARINALLGL